MKITEFEIDVNGRSLACGLAEPDGPVVSEAALLINFAGDLRSALVGEYYGDSVRKFVAAGHRAISFDLPSHGKRIAPWKAEGLQGCAEAVQAGVDPFTEFVSDGKAILDHCLRVGWARPGHIFVNGTSRGGYAGLRLAIDDPRINGVSALAPVTDWRALAEFESARHLPLLEDMALIHHIHHLAGRCVWVIIGNRDNRVSTDGCLRTMARLAETETTAGLQASRVWFNVVPSVGHGLPHEAYGQCADYLLESLTSAASAKPMGGLKATNTQA